jgi:C-terminal processing protease CtpA/Prc
MGAHVSRTARWLRRGVGLLLVLALLVCGAGRSLAQDKNDDKKDEPKKEEPKKEEPKKEEPKKPDRAELQKQLDEAQKLFDKARKEMDELRRQLQTAPPGGLTPPGFPPGFRPFRPQARFGVSVEEPGPALAEQLGLESGKGLVVTDVLPDSAAAKAGLKKYDVLIEFNGKPVPANRDSFAALVQEPKAKTPVDVVVIRKGKKETIKDVSLPEVSTPPARPGPAPFGAPRRG